MHYSCFGVIIHVCSHPPAPKKKRATTTHTHTTTTTTNKQTKSTNSIFFIYCLTVETHNSNSYPGGTREVTDIQHTVLAHRPLIKLFSNCISSKETQQLLTLASNRLTRDTDSGFSSSLYLRGQSDAKIPILRQIAMLAGNLSGLPWKLAESVSLTKYTANQSYGLHYDSGFMMHGKRMNRVITFLVYLNNVTKGGETVFPYAVNIQSNAHQPSSFALPAEQKPPLDRICKKEGVLKVSPKAGYCLLFYNNLPDSKNGVRDPMAIHGSCPVVQGDKWIAQIWLHDEPWGEGVTDFW